MNDQERTNYRMNEAEQRKRLSEWSDDTSEAADLSRELALCRTMLESAVKENNGPLARDLLKTLSQLADRHRIAETKLSVFLHKSVVLRLAREIGGLVAGEFTDVPGFEERLDRAEVKILATIKSARNPEELLGRL